jgi:hypothetical protein
VTVVGTPPTAGTSSQFTALAVLADGSTATVTSTAAWNSSNIAVATVTSGGMVTALASGSTDITAIYGGATGLLTITVPAAPTFTLSGTVTDSGTGRGLASATVQVSGTASRTTTTDATGRYSIAGLPGGTVSISVSAFGYISSTRSVTALSNATATQNFSLAPGTPCPALGFDDLTVEFATVTTSSMCGLTLRTTLASWFMSTYGRPGPALHFQANGSPVQGEVQVTAGGQRFRFLSADLYSSVTRIPYTFTGILGSATVFTVTDTQGNTFGNFVTVANPQSSVFVDSLVIRLTNDPGAGPNPMGIDNIRVSF